MKSRLVPALIWIAILSGIIAYVISCNSTPKESTGPSPSTAASTAAVVKPAAGKGGWMDGIPEAVPPFTYGIYSSQSDKTALSDKTIYTLYYKSVTLENGKEYLAKLKEKGFDVVENPARQGELSSGGQLRQGKGMIGIGFDVHSDNNAELTINVVQNYQ